MATVKSITLLPENDRPWSNGLRKRRYTIVLTDNNGVDHEVFTNPVKQQPEEDGAALANEYLDGKKRGDASSEDRAPLWMDTQADYDRVSLGYAMTLEDVHEFHSYLALFKAMEARSGNNAGQRASTLGVSIENYNAMASRFNDVEGIVFFLVDAKAAIWGDPRDFV